MTPGNAESRVSIEPPSPFGHICGGCFRPAELHNERCDRGCAHFPALCCAGCPCRSYEEAHGD